MDAIGIHVSVKFLATHKWTNIGMTLFSWPYCNLPPIEKPVDLHRLLTRPLGRLTLQVSYADTRRVFILSFGMLGFSTLSVGMWLYSLSSIYFWWYGVPSTFFTIYMCCQYFGVALWGKDFKLSEHARIVEEASERGFMPTVDVFLPVCNEPIPILANTWKYVSEMDYPHFKVFVLDDGAQDTVRDLAAVFGFECEFRLYPAVTHFCEVLSTYYGSNMFDFDIDHHRGEFSTQ